MEKKWDEALRKTEESADKNGWKYGIYMKNKHEDE